MLKGRTRGMFEWQRHCCFPPLTSSRNSKQTLKSTISPLVFPSDGEQWLNAVPGPPIRPPQRKKNKTIQSAKGTLAPVLWVCLFVCACVPSHCRATLVILYVGAARYPQGWSVARRAEKGGGDPVRSESLRWGIIRLKKTRCKHYPVKPSVDSILQTLERRKKNQGQQAVWCTRTHLSFHTTRGKKKRRGPFSILVR